MDVSNFEDPAAIPMSGVHIYAPNKTNTTMFSRIRILHKKKKQKPIICIDNNPIPHYFSVVLEYIQV